MKFSSMISVVVFLAALAWTWSIIHSKSIVPFETHAGIQDKLAQIIVETVKAKKPSASDIVVEKIWTESSHVGRVKAHFLYSFKDATSEGTVSSQISGFVDLEKGGQDGSGAERWIVAKVKTNSDAIVFEEGTTITPGTATEASPGSAPDAKSEGTADTKTENKIEKKPDNNTKKEH